MSSNYVNIAIDTGESNDVSAQHPDILQKMISAYEKSSKDVGVIVPRSAEFVAASKARLNGLD